MNARVVLSLLVAAALAVATALVGGLIRGDAAQPIEPISVGSGSPSPSPEGSGPGRSETPSPSRRAEEEGVGRRGGRRGFSPAPRMSVPTPESRPQGPAGDRRTAPAADQAPSRDGFGGDDEAYGEDDRRGTGGDDAGEVEGGSDEDDAGGDDGGDVTGGDGGGGDGDDGDDD